MTFIWCDEEKAYGTVAGLEAERKGEHTGYTGIGGRRALNLKGFNRNVGSSFQPEYVDHSNGFASGNSLDCGRQRCQAASTECAILITAGLIVACDPDIETEANAQVPKLNLHIGVALLCRSRIYGPSIQSRLLEPY